MGTLIRNVAASSAIKMGVNVLDVAPPTSPIGTLNRTIGIVGEFPWGPVNVVTECLSFADFQAKFCPAPFNALNSYTPLRAFLGHSFPGPFRVCRIAPTGTVAVQCLNPYPVAGGAYVFQATYPGLLGSSITITFAAATNADAAQRNITIAIGTLYSRLYENVTTTSILSLGDIYGTWTATSSPSALPAAGASATSPTAGADGVAVAGDYVGSSSSNVGIRKFYASNQSAAVLFVAECPAALIATVNTGLVAYADGAGKSGVVLLSSVASQSVSAASTYVASYRSTTSKVIMVWPRIEVTNTFSSTFPKVTVDGNAIAAACIASVDPWRSPEGVNSAPYLTAISALETADSPDGTIDTMKDLGIASFFIEDTLGPILMGAVTTNIVSGQTDIIRSMYRAYVGDNLAAYAIRYLGVPLDVDLTGGTLGANTGGLVDSIMGFLTNEESLNHINGFSVDPFGSNLSADIDAGRWTIATAIDTYAPLRTVVLTTQIGSTVIVSS